MRLTLSNYCTHLIFYPFDADTKQERIIALVASIACGILTVGICHAVCAAIRYFTHRSVEFKVPEEVKPTLNRLFEGSSYSLNTLPVYPTVLNELNHPNPVREEMAAPVMKGMFDDGRAFIVIKLDCTLSDENIENSGIEEEYKNLRRGQRQLKDILMLFQYRVTDPLMWDQLGRSSGRPSFFTWNFTYAEDGTGPTKSQEGNFKLVQTLLKTGESPDTHGLIWRISR